MVSVVCLVLCRMGVFKGIIRSGSSNGLWWVMQLTEPHILLLLMKLIGRNLDERWSCSANCSIHTCSHFWFRGVDWWSTYFFVKPGRCDHGRSRRCECPAGCYSSRVSCNIGLQWQVVSLWQCDGQQVDRILLIHLVMKLLLILWCWSIHWVV